MNKVETKNNKNDEKKALIKGVVNSYMLIVFANLLRAFSIHYFILPYSFAPGGVTGIATLLNFSFDKISVAYFLLILNAPLIILSFFFYNRSYSIKTLVGLALSTLMLLLFEKFDELTKYKVLDALSVGNDRILAAIAGGVMSGIALALIFNSGGSNAGTEIIAGILQRKMPTVNISWFVSMLDSTVILVSFFIYKDGMTPIMLALIQLVVYSKVCDIILSGMKTAIKVEVVTANPKELGVEIMKTMRRGVTLVDAMGMYTSEERSLMICIIRKRQLPDFYKLLKRFPDAFAYITSTNEVIGRGFTKTAAKDTPKIPNIESHIAHPHLKESERMSDSLDLENVELEIEYDSEA